MLENNDERRFAMKRHTVSGRKGGKRNAELDRLEWPSRGNYVV